jgi:tRNA nucleotidyltransferase (CCA-adding enzyme)
MARAGDGTLIDPYGGADDLKAGVLRHVSPAFAEDPLRVLRVARFAARFEFRIADATLALMRDIVATGELATLAPERVWQELARGLAETHPARMLAALRACGALATLIPEIDALYATPLRRASAGVLTERALDWSAAQAHALPVRYAVLTQELDWFRDGAGASRVSARTGVARAEAVSARLKVPLDCRDAARLAARWHRVVARVETLPPARLLDLLTAADALRRPERLDMLVASTAAHVAASNADPACRVDRAAALLRDALAVVRGVDAGGIAIDVIKRASKAGGSRSAGQGDRIAAALRAARLVALRVWKRRGSGMNPRAAQIR